MASRNPSNWIVLATALVVAPPLLAATSHARLEPAIAAQRALVAEHPGDAGALNDLGNLLLESGDVDAAESAYREALAADPLRSEPRYNLALLLHSRDQRRAAGRQLRQLLRDHPEHARGHYQLGTVQLNAGNRSRALRHYRRAFRLDPSLVDARNNPHVVDNPLATAAMLGAFRRIARTSPGTRIYSDPARIAGLLLPALAGSGEEPAAAPEPEMPTVQVRPPVDAQSEPPPPEG